MAFGTPMAATLASPSNTTLPLPPHCAPTTPLLAALSSTLNTCLPTPLAATSTLLGYLSVLAWLFAQLPQIYTNFRARSTAGLSLGFLGVWCAGDGLNFAGGLLTGQQGWQVVLAAYYTVVDLTLVVQYFWYSREEERGRGRGEEVFLDGVSVFSGSVDGEEEGKKEEEGKGKGKSTGGHLTRGGGRANAMTQSLLLLSMLCAIASNAHAAPMPMPTGTATTSATASDTPASFLPSPEEPQQPTPTPSSSSLIASLGTLTSWTSTLLYLLSRLPQLHHNFTRKSTSGLSPLLFLAAFTGNLFYSASMLTNPCAWQDMGPHGGRGWVGEEGSNRAEWVSRAVPFFLGAAGVLILDGCVGLQFLVYGDGDGIVAQTAVEGKGVRRDTALAAQDEGDVSERQALLFSEGRRSSVAAAAGGGYGSA